MASNSGKTAGRSPRDRLGHTSPEGSGRIAGKVGHGFGLFVVVAFLSVSGIAQAIPATRNAKDTRFEDALELYKAGQAPAAIYMLQQLAKDHPSDSKVYLKLAEMAVEQKNWAYGIQTLAQAARCRPDDIVVRQVLMSIYAAYQMPIEEIMVGKEILAVQPRNKKIIRRLVALCFKQNLFEDEALMRSKLHDLDPGDYENMLLLADLYCRTGKVVEEINTLRSILKRWPDRREHRIRLAALYGETSDHYNELDILKTLPAGRRDPVARKMKRKAVALHRLDQKILNMYEPTLHVLREESPEVHISRSGSESVTVLTSLSKYQDFGLWLRYDHLDYTGTNLLLGTRKIDSYDWQFRRITEWDRERSKLTLGLGMSHVGVGGSLVSRYGIGLNPADFPFMEDREFGGSTPIAKILYETRIRPRLTLQGWILREIMPDVDAQVRMVVKHEAGGNATYSWFDNTRAALNYAIYESSDDNTSQNARFSLERVFLGKLPEHDLGGHRSGFSESTPSSCVLLKYQADYLDTRRRSNLYQYYPDEIEHEVSAVGEVRLSRFLFFKGEEVWATGNNVLLAKWATNLDLGWRDRQNNNELSLRYGWTLTRVNSSTTNQTLQGETKIKELQLVGRWNF